MSQQLHNFILAVQKMPHWANQHSTGKQRVDSHEEALATELTAQGYVEEKLSPKGTPKSKKKYPKLSKKALLAAIDIEDPAERQKAIASLVQGMAVGTFFRQPCGGQSFPDFLVRDFSGTFVVIEAKSGKKGTPTWNDSIPRNGCIYIMSSEKYSGSTFFLGEDYINNELREEIKIVKIKIKLFEKEMNALLAKFNSSRGIRLYIRAKWEQYGQSIVTDPFIHLERAACEQNVLAFALAQ